MENTNTRGEPLESALDRHLRLKRQADQQKLDDELRVRAQQVQVLQGMTMQVGLFTCPHCGNTLLDSRAKAPEEDYDTRA